MTQEERYTDEAEGSAATGATRWSSPAGTSKAKQSAASDLGLPQLSSSPLSSQVLNGLVRAIQDGRFPGGRLPPENELAKAMGVSRTTVRSALRSLEQIGMIDRRQGRRGTRLRQNVTPEVLAIHGLVPFSALLGQKHQISSRASLALHDRPAHRITGRLEVAEPCYEISRLLYADGEPVISMREWIPRTALARPLTDADTSYHSILEIAAAAFARPIDHAVAKLVPKAVGPADQQRLRLAAGEAFLFLDETFYSVDEAPLALSFVSVNPHAVEFSIFRRHP